MGSLCAIVRELCSNPATFSISKYDQEIMHYLIMEQIYSHIAAPLHRKTFLSVFQNEIIIEFVFNYNKVIHNGNSSLIFSFISHHVA